MDKALVLNSKTKASIEKRVGLKPSRISKMSSDEVNKVIESNIGEKLEFTTKIGEFIGRGLG